MRDDGQDEGENVKNCKVQKMRDEKREGVRGPKCVGNRILKRKQRKKNNNKTAEKANSVEKNITERGTQKLVSERDKRSASPQNII